MLFIRIASILMCLVIILGAFGAHGLKNHLSDYGLDIWQKAVFYHAIHALGVFVVAWLMQSFSDPRIALSGWLMLAGVVFFSGSLYTLALTDIKWLGAITPIGGLLFILAWANLIFIKS